MVIFSHRGTEHTEKNNTVNCIAKVAESYITDIINNSNVNERTVWQKTNQQNVYIVSIRLNHQPYENTILIWTGTGILPSSSYKIERTTLSVILNQPKEAFVSSNNFITIRYLPKEQS